MSAITLIAATLNAPVLEFNPEWYKNSASNGLVNYRIPGPLGVVHKFVDTRDRKGAAVSTRFGTVVAYTRYANDNFGAVISNFPSKLRNMLPDSEWDEHAIFMVFGRCGRGNDNIHYLIEHLRNTPAVFEEEE